MKLSQHNLYHRFLKLLKEKGIQKTSILVACSGGIDSIALVSLLKAVSKPLHLKLSVAYVHHGLQKNSYRTRSQIFIECLAHMWNLPFFTNAIGRSYLKSEASLRKYRYQFLQEWKKKSRSQWLALAHTTDDLLETRLIRLIRGTGMQGLGSMQFLEKDILRPLIYFTKEEIKEMVLQQKIEWIEDPTNKKMDPLRNWIRQVWLKKLEQKHQGAGLNLARSLERIVEEGRMGLRKYPPLSLDAWSELDLSQKRAFLATWMLERNLKNYTQRHIEEVIKRLEKRPISSFQMLGHWWLIQNKKIVLK